MYRWLCALCCLFLLTSCASKSVAPVVSGFRCQVELAYDGTIIVGELDRTDPSRAVLTVSEPAAVSGLTMVCSGDELALSYAGMTLALKEEQMPAGVAAKALCKTLDACVTGEGETPVSRMEGEGDCGSYTVEFDEQTGLPLKLDLPALALTVTFSKWQLPA